MQTISQKFSEPVRFLMFLKVYLCKFNSLTSNYCPTQQLHHHPSPPPLPPRLSTSSLHSPAPPIQISSFLMRNLNIYNTLVFLYNITKNTYKCHTAIEISFYYKKLGICLLISNSAFPLLSARSQKSATLQ